MAEGILSTAYHYATKDISDAGETNLANVCFSDNGSYFYIIGTANDRIYQYDMGTAYDISTAANSGSLSVSGSDGTPRAVFLRPTGTQMFMMGTANETIFRWQLGTAYDIDTAGTRTSRLVDPPVGTPRGLAFANGGLKMYVADNDDRTIHEYTLSTAYRLDTTVTYIDYKDISAVVGTNIYGLWISNDGTSCYVLNGSKTVFRFTFGTAYDITTLSYASDSFDLSPYVNSARGLWFKFPNKPLDAFWVCDLLTQELKEFRFRDVTAPQFSINIGDVWKTASAVQINIGDVWKDVSTAQINISDTWKTS